MGDASFCNFKHLPGAQQPKQEVDCSCAINSSTACLQPSHDPAARIGSGPQKRQPILVQSVYLLMKLEETSISQGTMQISVSSYRCPC